MEQAGQHIKQIIGNPVRKRDLSKVECFPQFRECYASFTVRYPNTSNRQYRRYNYRRETLDIRQDSKGDFIVTSYYKVYNTKYSYTNTFTNRGDLYNWIRTLYNQ